MIKLTDGSGLISTKGQAELHKFATKAGINRKCYLAPANPKLSGCYILPTKKLRRKVLALGAVAC